MAIHDNDIDETGAMSPRHIRWKIAAKTASYTVTEDDWGKMFTNRGATGAVTFTLPAPAESNAGRQVAIMVVANQNVILTTSAGNELVVFNNATATSIAFQTASEKIGNSLVAISDGTSYLIQVHLGAETATPTIA